MPPRKSPTTLESRPLDWFRPYARNARTHDTTQVERLKQVIRENGFRDPIEATPEGDIIAGHGRLQAARELGLEEVLTLVHHDMTPMQVTAYRIANNRIAELSGWDRVLLATEINDLRDSLGGEEAELPELGFDEAGLELLLRELNGTPPEQQQAGSGEGRGLGNPVISYVLVFDDSGQQDRWFEFVRHLKTIYPGGDLTVAAMLNEYIIRSMGEDRAGA